MAISADITPEVGSSRRALLTAAGFTGLAAVAAVGWMRPDLPAAAVQVGDQEGLDGGLHSLQSSTGPDAELIALCAAFDEFEQQRIQSHAEDGEDDEVEAFRDDLFDKQEPLLRQIVTLRATTMEGARARARMLRLWDAELEKNGRHEDDFWNSQMIWALVRDLTGAA
ncbi:hypothetical protein [Lichenicoccus roseus]|uniref:Uncharacterized protein n=1 Tax=Lichenicoccus roseus TaxID=2683649 RepID=A0A5R9JB59_9PROT|nr:hypothetical protein [Lichenicoccus roseus]TLU71478.1 hypothetical protein FE263_16400 [Lichenicoccus roseus]